MKNDVNAEVGQRVADLRGQRGWSQGALAERLSLELGKKMEPLTVTRLEGGKRPISVAEIVALATVFEMRPVDLLPEQTPLLSELTKWKVILGSRSHDLDAAQANAFRAQQDVMDAQGMLDGLMVLLEAKRTGQITTPEVGRAIQVIGQRFPRAEDLVSILTEVGLDSAVVQLALDEVDSRLEVAPTEERSGRAWIRSARLAASLSRRLGTDDTTT